MVTLAVRFWRRVKRGTRYSCWPWLGPRNQKGYGLAATGSRTEAAHRVAWTLTHGPIPQGKFALHRCDNPPCCNPRHLFLGTQIDNMADMRRKGRHPAMPAPGLSWVDIARELGCSDSMLSHVFGSGRKRGSVDLLSRVARITGLPLDQVVALRGKGQQRFQQSICSRAPSQIRKGRKERASRDGRAA